MANFRALIRGQRGEASRLGSKQSGIVAHVDGWHSGVTVRVSHVDGRDLFSVYRTSGSTPRAGSGANETLIAQWFATEAIDYPQVRSYDVKIGN
jgi:hypothetical protein